MVNNAVCSWLIKHHSGVEIAETLSCQASFPRGWSDCQFAEFLHGRFLEALERGEIRRFYVPDFEVSLSRFSINCIGFFGRDVRELGERFCPPGCDDEEWISAVLPSLTGRPGRIVGGLIAAHFSYFPQESRFLRSPVLDNYYRIAGVRPPVREASQRSAGLQFIRALRAVKAWALQPMLVLGARQGSANVPPAGRTAAEPVMVSPGAPERMPSNGISKVPGGLP